MPQPRTFTLLVAADMPADEREALLDALAAQSVALSESEARDPVSAWLVFMGVLAASAAVAKNVKEIAGAANETIKLAETLKAWRDKSRAAGVTPAARLQAPGRPDLDLAHASDAELLAWFLESPAA